MLRDFYFFFGAGIPEGVSLIFYFMRKRRRCNNECCHGDAGVGNNGDNAGQPTNDTLIPETGKNKVCVYLYPPHSNGKTYKRRIPTKETPLCSWNVLKEDNDE